MTARAAVHPGSGAFWTLVLLLGFPWEGYFSAPVKSATAAHWALANMALAPVVAFAALALDQALLAGIARAVGDCLAKISIGVGPQLWPRRGKSARVVVRLLPVNWRHAQYTPRAQGQRVRTALTHLGAAAILVGLIALDVTLQHTSWSVMKIELGTRLAPDVLFVACASWLALQSLMVGVGVLVKPGSMSVDDKVLKARRAWGAAVFAGRAMRRGQPRAALALARRAIEEEPDNVTFQALFVEMLVSTRDPTAFDRLVELKERTPPSTLRTSVLNLWAWEAYMRDELALRDEACEILEVLVRGDPDNLSLVDTYAHMLLWAGRDAAGEPHLARAEAGAPNAQCRASSACGLAILHARRGDFASARRWLTQARAHDSTNMMLPRAAALVEVPGCERP